jgi:hydroxyethylthiazole kinase-like uncharacterized protein yjeF
MQRLYDEVNSLDKRCYSEFYLSEDILMEHAANGMASHIKERFQKGTKVIIVCGSGNNGADGIACARLLHGDYDVEILYVKNPKSDMAILQSNRAKAIGVKQANNTLDAQVVVDAIVGTGFKGEFNSQITQLIQRLNKLDAYKIACDIPSCGFIADTTLTMGGLKKSLFLDEMKDKVGKIEVLDLGISRCIYEKNSSWNLLDLEDMKLPFRDKKDSHKGSFGHLALACGDKPGASILSALSALRFGCGLVTLVGYENLFLPHSILYSHTLAKNTTALALGMGLGDEFSNEELDKFLDNTLPLIVDADIFSKPILHKILQRKNIVLTPHPKEFVSLLKATKLADISISKLQKERFKYVEIFADAYPDATLLLKGANVIIAKKDEFYINPHGKANLAKGGSGDVLSGLIGALLAQGYTPLQSAINASLAHTKLSLNYKGADFSLTPDDLIEEICNL